MASEDELAAGWWSRFTGRWKRFTVARFWRFLENWNNFKTITGSRRRLHYMHCMKTVSCSMACFVSSVKIPVLWHQFCVFEADSPLGMIGMHPHHEWGWGEWGHILLHNFKFWTNCKISWKVKIWIFFVQSTQYLACAHPCRPPVMSLDTPHHIISNDEDTSPHQWGYWGNIPSHLPKISNDILHVHWNLIITLILGVHSDISVTTEQPYNEGLIHRKYKQWEPCLYANERYKGGCYNEVKVYLMK